MLAVDDGRARPAPNTAASQVRGDESERGAEPGEYDDTAADDTAVALSSVADPMFKRDDGQVERQSSDGAIMHCWGMVKSLSRFQRKRPKVPKQSRRGRIIDKR